MQRYFLEGKVPDNRQMTITGDDAKHIAKVMRQDSGDQVLVVVEETAYLATIMDAQFDVDIEIGEKIETVVELPKRVTIACGLPKGDKLELIVQKATELGMYGLIPYTAERSIVKWDRTKGEKKQQRLQKIAKEAAEQSHRTHIPMIQPVHSFKELIAAAASYDAVIVAYEETARASERTRFAEILASVYDRGSLLFVFGPEGGISEQEVAGLQAINAIFTSLGPRILRTETAPLYALSAISYEFE